MLLDESHNMLYKEAMAKSATTVTRGSSPRMRAGAKVSRDPSTEEFAETTTVQSAVMKAARNSGLLGEKTSRISGRVSPKLVTQAKRRTGITKDSDLIAYALANIALEDDFPRVFGEVRGAVDHDLDLEF